MEEIPGLVQAARENKKHGVDVLLVSYDLQGPRADRSTVVERVKKFVDARKWGLPVMVLDAPSTDAINERFDLPGPIPVTLAFDKHGKLVDRQEGEADPARFAEMMERARGL